MNIKKLKKNEKKHDINVITKEFEEYFHLVKFMELCILFQAKKHFFEAKKAMKVIS